MQGRVWEETMDVLSAVCPETRQLSLDAPQNDI